MRRRLFIGVALIAAAFSLASPAHAQSQYEPGCAIALMLAVDVSGSIDSDEFSVQMGGLANALRDPEIVDALAGSRALVALTQWSGTSRQRLSIPWRTIDTPDDALAFAAEVAATPRAWRNFSTGIGQALMFAADRFADAPRRCARRVIDVSGDGVSNEGPSPQSAHRYLADNGFQVNGLAIEGSVQNLTAYFREAVIVGPGAFVVTAEGFDDYPRAIRLKLLRELLTPIAFELDVGPIEAPGATARR